MVVVTASNDGDAAKKKQYTLQTGILSSALEHAVPEQMFTNAQNPGEAISAVKAIQKASAAGQRIYHITQANQAAILGNIHHDADTMTDIRNALNAGKEVITHTDKVSVPGWTGAGYIITDVDTGAGAFKIAGGGNGGGIFGEFMDKVAPFLALYGLGLGLLSLVPAFAAFASTLFFVSFLISLTLAIDSLILYLMTADFDKCGAGRLELFAVPIFLSAFGALDFIPETVAIALFSAAFITDGAINNSCNK